MLVTTGDLNQNYEIIGVVKGARVRSVNTIKDFGASIKNIIGGELKSYTKLLSETREIAFQDMINEAHAMSADAIISVRFSCSQIVDGAAEILVYGTAVKII